MRKLSRRSNDHKRLDVYGVREACDGYYVSHPSFEHTELGPLETRAQATVLIRRLKRIARAGPKALTPAELCERKADRKSVV